MTAINRRFAGLFVWHAAFFASAALAQTTAPSSDKKSEVVELSPFEVRAAEDRGYIASETMTGTRVATQIKDLPYSVNVLTSEFFEDFAIFQLDDTLTQIGGLTGLDIGGNFNLRGFASSSQLRDGFYRLGRYGQTNIDRIEVIKGPNAGIYGRTSPGGMVNMISIAPKKQDHQELTLRYGDYDTKQGTFKATGTLFDPNTYYVLSLSQYVRGWDMDWAKIRENQAFLAIKHDFADGSHLLASAEYFFQYRHAPTSAAPVIIDQKGTAATADDEAIGYAKNLAQYNAYGPHSELNRASYSALLSYDKRLNGIFSLRAAGQVFQARRWDYNQNTGFGTVTINSTTAANNLTSTRGALPNRGLIFEDGGGFQADLVANYPLFKSTVTNKTLLSLDVNDYYRYDPTYNTGADAATVAWAAAGSGRVVALNADYTPKAPLTYFTEPFNWNNTLLTRLTRRRSTVAGGQIRHESHWMNDKLLTYVGARYDAARFQERDYVATINGVKSTFDAPYSFSRVVHQLKPNFGALYKVRDSFRVYANYSQSYFVNQTDNPVDVGSVEYKPETAKGYDFGVKGSFFHDKLNYTIGGYYINRFNVSVSDTVESPVGSGNFISVTRRDGDQLDRGIEADVNWSIDHNFSTGLSYGHVNAIYTDFGSAFPEAVGRKVNNVSPTNGSAYLKFNGTNGALQGFSANIGVTYVSATPTEVPNAGDTTARVNGVQVVTASNGQWKLTVPAYTLWNLGFHYKLKSNAHIEHAIHLNINNVFDESYLRTSGSFAKNISDGRAVFVSYTLGFSDLLKH
jgi:iron complex outermembrane receptor protein